MRQMAIIGAASGWGSQNPGAEAGPDYLRRRGLVDRLRAADIDAHWHATVTTKAPRRTIAEMTGEQSFPLVVEHNKRQAKTLARTVNGDHLPVVVGGDHAIAIGTWSAMTAALGAEGEFGLIWVDAHMDAHTPETADQGKWGGYYHGRPLACLLGRGEPELKQIASPRAKIAPQHVSLIGVRSYEAGEAKLLSDLGVHVHHMSEVERRGFAAVFEESRKRAGAAAAGYGVTIDLDGFDPENAPGVGSPESGGLSASDVVRSMRGLAADNRFKALEIAEYNPERDLADATAKLIANLLISLIS